MRRLFFIFIVLCLSAIQVSALTSDNFSSVEIYDTTGLSFTSVRFFDYENDGEFDFLSTYYSTEGLLIYHHNNSDGTFATTSFGGYYALQAIDVGDIDDDGDIDIALISSQNHVSTRQLNWFENDGVGGFEKHVISTDNSVLGENVIKIIDLDSDNDKDLIYVSRTFNVIKWYENNGAESFTPHVISTATRSPRSYLDVGDLDEDGDIDILTNDENDYPLWYENNGAESFTPHVIANNLNEGDGKFYDIDEDGDIDVLALGYGWYENNGAESFTSHAITSFTSGYSMRIVDLDNDNLNDIVVSLYASENVRYFKQGANYSFTNTLLSSISSTYSDVLDYDDDGDVDIISGGNNGVYLLTNNLITPPQPISIAVTSKQNTVPLTSTLIQSDDSTGGFVSSTGQITLTPNSRANKTHTLQVTDTALIDGFELEVTADGAEVTTLIITINNLGADRTYNIYLDDQFVEKIGGVTSYQYNMTSFSTHTLKIEYDYYVPPGEEEGGGSGGITPPDEDITPPDEDGIIIEDDVITIGELTITKEEFQLLTVEQIEAMNVSQDTKDKLIAIKSINVDWWLFILVISLTGLIVESSHKKGHESIIIISFIGVVISAYKLGYF